MRIPDDVRKVSVDQRLTWRALRATLARGGLAQDKPVALLFTIIYYSS